MSQSGLEKFGAYQKARQRDMGELAVSSMFVSWTLHGVRLARHVGGTNGWRIGWIET